MCISPFSPSLWWPMQPYFLFRLSNTARKHSDLYTRFLIKWSDAIFHFAQTGWKSVVLYLFCMTVICRLLVWGKDINYRLLVSVLNPLCFYISTFRSMCAVPNMAVFCSSLTSCFPTMLLTYFLNDFEIVPVALFVTGITFVFIFHMRCISIVRPLYLKSCRLLF